MKKALLVLLMAAGSASHAKDRLSCDGLNRIVLSQHLTISAEWVTAGTFQPPPGPYTELVKRVPLMPQPEFSELQAFCRVKGIARPTKDSLIHFEVWLPTINAWNGRFYQHGEGGGGGRIHYGALEGFVRDGAVGAASDDGLQGTLFDLLATANDHPDKLIDNFYRAMGETTNAAKWLIRHFYGKSQEWSYFEGCSGGGNYGLKAAQRFPEQWDGILVGAPTMDVTGTFAYVALSAQLGLDPSTRIRPEKLPAIERAARATCAPAAHVVDGIATDPRHCSFDPQTMLCRGAETNECLTAAQAATLRQAYEGTRDPPTGKRLHPGFPPASESTWAKGLVLATPELANSFYRFVFNDPQWDVRQFSLERDSAFAERMKVSDETLGAITNVGAADMLPLRKRGSKILMYYGWEDSYATPLMGIAFYKDVVRQLGNYAETSSFLRLFLSPGMSHCGSSGPGANAFGQGTFARALRDDPDHNIMRALESWVENGRAPDRVIAAKYVGDHADKGVAFTRLLCPYPQIAVYSGEGDRREAGNFQCRSPENNGAGRSVDGQ